MRIRPVKTSLASVAGGGATATSAWRLSCSRTIRASVDRDHDVGGLDHGIGRLADRELEFVDGRVGDGGRDDRAADIEADMRRGRALGDLDDGALELVAGADLHVACLRS